MPSYPQEYTPEMTEEFYKSLARPIEERTNANVGRVRGEALARGLEGDPWESLGVASTRDRGTNALSDLWSNISMQGAGMARQERLAGEERESSQGFQSKMQQQGYGLGGIYDTNRAELARRAANQQYDIWRDKMAYTNRQDYQTAIWNKLGDLNNEGLDTLKTMYGFGGAGDGGGGSYGGGGGGSYGGSTANAPAQATTSSLAADQLKKLMGGGYWW